MNDALGKSSLAGITLKIDVFVSPQLALSPLVLSVILGNTLDNAIRACSGVSADTPKIVSLTLRQKDSILYYRISNPYDPEFSSKKREGIHGYGLKNVSSTVEQIGGTMQINQENNLYTVEIILNLVKQRAIASKLPLFIYTFYCIRPTKLCNLIVYFTVCCIIQIHQMKGMNPMQ